MEKKIDLAEIEELAAVLPKLNSKESDGVCLSFADCERIAAALEQLPKLVAALGTLQDTIDYMELERSQSLVIGKPEKEIIKQALEPFA